MGVGPPPDIFLTDINILSVFFMNFILIIKIERMNEIMEYSTNFEPGSYQSACETYINFIDFIIRN